ncbi:protein kinase [Anaerolineales bacterium HSG6]|nr:protein kinase [Anaerolineales bacterium HSG6]MDM8531065.1 protein kinase [Anaerolineales bacterium HSG25]
MKLPVVFNNRYQLIKKIGEGGLAEVYQAQDMALGRMVAVKALRDQYTRDPSFLVNFHREAQSVARLSDPFIVAVYDFGQDEARPYIVFEWIPGSDLRTLLDEQKILSPNQVVEYGIQICSAVGTAHRAGLVHGDMKPGNILVTPNNQAKVTDFGLAKALGASAMDDGEVVWGTPAYFAPEQASGDRVLPATDVYAIGIILYEMLSGQLPFKGADDQEVARKQIYEAHIPIDQLNPSIPEPLARIVDAAMAKNVNERFLTADHLREALMAYKRGGLGIPSQHHSPIASVVGSPVQGQPSYTAPPPPPAYDNSYVSASQVSAQKKGGNKLGLIIIVFGVLVILAILTLIPIFVAVYATYLQGASLPIEAPSNQVEVPDLIGMDETVAQSALENMGLSLLVEGEEHHTTWPTSAIIRQSIDGGQRILHGDSVGVILSKGPIMVTIPDLMGMTTDEAEALLISLDLVPQKYEDWSVKTPGSVIRQDPPAGMEVEDRTLITLVVSSGSRVPIGVNFGQQVLLNAYEIPQEQFRIGDTINLTFFWKVIPAQTEDISLFVTLTTVHGGIVSEFSKPVETWNNDDIIVEAYQIPIPDTTASGDYQIRVTFFNSTGERLEILDVGRGQKDDIGDLILRPIQIIP